MVIHELDEPTGNLYNLPDPPEGFEFVSQPGWLHVEHPDLDMLPEVTEVWRNTSPACPIFDLPITYNLWYLRPVQPTEH